MSDTAIQVENLSKLYHLGRSQQRNDTLRDELVGALRGLNPFKKNGNSEAELLWALKDVSFEVKQGEVLGIIGRNGAGKSTLLKILSRITEPTSGRAVLNGRVASLLEVGTGFHPELTGRENIYLYGAVLGMQRIEITRKFAEIVAFAEIEKFLDTPVKRYSSGMYMRLAFAVAAHLEPEILLVDEVLAVGDASFQKKCLGKMGEVASAGRTVLFVSHNTNAVQQLCDWTMLMSRGRLQQWGRTLEVVAAYLSDQADSIQPGSWKLISNGRHTLPERARFSGIHYTSGLNEIEGHAYVDGPLQVSVQVISSMAQEVDSMSVTFYDEHGTKLVNCDSETLGGPVRLEPGQNQLSFHIRQLHLNPGVYTLGLWMASANNTALDHLNAAARIEVLESPETAGMYRPQYDGIVSNQFSITTETHLLSSASKVS